MNEKGGEKGMRYIDADALIEVLQEWRDTSSLNDGAGNPVDSILYDVIRRIEDAPAADVAPREEVAREIFEELRKYIINHCYLADDDVDAIWKHIDMLEKKYMEAEPPKEKQPKCSENFEKQRLLPGDCFHGEIWYMCPYCFTGIEAHSIPKDRICHKCGKEYL